VDVQKKVCPRCKVAQWSYCMAGDFGALAGLASTCSGAAILLHAWPHKKSALPASPFLWCLGTTDRGRTGTLRAIGDLERTVEVSWQTCHSRWRLWCRGSVVSRAIGRWLTPGVFGARRRRPAKRPGRHTMVVQ
jgi:hypothetical protein